MKTTILLLYGTHVVFIVLFKLVLLQLLTQWMKVSQFLTFKPVGKTLVFDHPTESCGAVLSCGIVYIAVQGGSNLTTCNM